MQTSEQNSDEPDRKQSDLAEGELDTVEESIRIHENRDKKTGQKGPSRAEDEENAA